MSMRPRLSTLPPGVRDQLHRRLVAANFGDLVNIAAWLTERGFPITKSAVGVYAKRNRVAIEAEAKNPPPRRRARPAADLVEIRLRCLQIASTVQSGDVVERAATLLDWVTSGKG